MDENMDNLLLKLKDVEKRQMRAIEDVHKEYEKVRRPLCEEQREMAKSLELFWTKAFRNHPDLTKFISPVESNVLLDLKDFGVVEKDDQAGSFDLSFTFDDGEYTHKCEVVKSFRYNPESGELDVSSADIKWKPEKAPPGAEGRKRKRDESEPLPKINSFFEWLVETHDQPGIGNNLRRSLWPKALEYYLGSGNDDELDDDEDDEDEDFDDEEEEAPFAKRAHMEGDEDDEDDDEDDEEEDDEGDDAPMPRGPPPVGDDDDEDDDEEDEEDEEEE